MTFRPRLAVAAVLTASLLASTSCIGSFRLTHKLLSWNQGIGQKFVNELVFVAFWILPVYEVSALADLLVLNSIEFWSGDNPVAQAPSTRTVEGDTGRYMVTTDAKGYTVVPEGQGADSPQAVRFDYDQPSRTWKMRVGQGPQVDIFTFVDDTHVRMADPSTGAPGAQVVELSDAGVWAYQQQAMAAGRLTAQR